MFTQLIEIIKTGSPVAVKGAQKEIEKIIGRRDLDRKILNKELEVFIAELKTFDNIKDVDHQAYFINTLKWPLLYIGRDHPEAFEEFFIKYLQHPSGKIRQALINAIDWLDATRFTVRDEWVKNVPDEDIERDRRRFCEFTYKITQLLEWHYRKEYGKYKYIRSMPPSVYKSLQMVLDDHLLISRQYEDLFDEFMYEEKGLVKEKGKADRRVPDVIQKTLLRDFKEKHVMLQRKALREAMVRMLETKGAQMKFEDIEKMVYEETGPGNVFDVFYEKTGFLDEESMRLLNDIWNHFPHRSLNGLSPVEMVMKSQLENK